MARITRTLWLVVPVLAALLAPDLAAQKRRSVGDGFWIAAGAGPGWARVACDICRARRDPVTTGFVRLGGAASGRLLIAAELAASIGGDGEVDENSWAFAATAFLYPSRSRRWYLKGGMGYMIHHAEDGTNVISATGYGPQFGIGYEFPVGRTWRLAPFFNAAFGSIGSGVKFNGATVQESANVTLLQIGISFVRH
jgi:hypothetical protein